MQKYRKALTVRSPVEVNPHAICRQMTAMTRRHARLGNLFYYTHVTACLMNHE